MQETTRHLEVTADHDALMSASISCETTYKNCDADDTWSAGGTFAMGNAECDSNFTHASDAGEVR